MGREIAVLVELVEELLAQQSRLEAEWVGRRLRLLEPFGRLPAPQGGHVLLDVGAVGVVVRLRLVAEAPLVLRFHEFQYDVAPLPRLLEVLDD